MKVGGKKLTAMQYKVYRFVIVNGIHNSEGLEKLMYPNPTEWQSKFIVPKIQKWYSALKHLKVI